MSAAFLFMADLLVGVLLIATIVSSVRLSRRIANLKGDEAAMRATIGELLAASDAAERAVTGLRATLSECDRDLAERIEMAHRHAQDLGRVIAAGEKVMGGVERIVETTRRVVSAQPRPVVEEPAQAPPRPGHALQAALAAAQEVAHRSARRFESRAA